VCRGSQRLLLYSDHFHTHSQVHLFPKKTTAPTATRSTNVSTLHVSPAADFPVAVLDELLVEEALPLIKVVVEPLNSSLIPTMLTPVSFAHAEPESKVAVLLKVMPAHYCPSQPCNLLTHAYKETHVIKSCPFWSYSRDLYTRIRSICQAQPDRECQLRKTQISSSCLIEGQSRQGDVEFVALVPRPRLMNTYVKV
jgi:hypothetical protein